MGKIYIADLASVLVKKHKIDKHSAQLFISNMVKVIQDGLDADRIVKVKGLGTFKIVDVEARESVNVNTGERLTIESHSKLAFLPDSTMKELVNKPFSLFETVPLNEGVDFSDLSTIDPAEEDEEPQMDTKTILEAKPVEEPLQEEKAIQEEEAILVEETLQEKKIPQDENGEKASLEVEEEEVVLKEDTPQEDEASQEEVIPQEDETSQEKNIPKEAEASLVDEAETKDDEQLEMSEADDAGDSDEVSLVADVIGQQPEYDEEYADDEEEQDAGSRRRWWLWLLAVLVLAGGAAAFYLLQGRNSQTAAAVGDADTLQTATSQPAAADRVSQPAASDSAQNVTPPPAAEVQYDWQHYDSLDNRTRTGAYAIMGLDHIIIVKEGDTTRRIAIREAGSNQFACYIEVFNGITSDTPLEPGSELRIPKLMTKRELRRQLNKNK